MIRNESHPFWPIFAFLAAFPSPRAVMAAESDGAVFNYCASGPFYFTFSALPESCSVDMAGPLCPQSQPGDLTMTNWVLRAPGGIMDYGPLEDFGLSKEFVLPSAGYGDSVPFQPRRLFAVKVGEKGYALFSEVNGFIGGCLHQEFRWRYNDSGNHFSRVPVGVRLGSKNRAGALDGKSRSGIAARTESRAIDARGRSMAASSGAIGKPGRRRHGTFRHPEGR